MSARYLGIKGAHPIRPDVGTYNLYILSTDSKYYLQTSTQEVDLSAAGTSVHNDLSSIQGGSSSERYHLTSAQHTEATRNASGSQNGLLSSADWTTFSKYPKNHLVGCTVSRLSNTQLQISVGQARDSADAYNIAVSGTLTVAITSSGANGLDTGSEAASTPYVVYVCVGTSGVCGLLSVSTTPTLPVGYQQGYRRVGSWINNASSNFVTGFQVGSGNIRETTFSHARLDALVLALGSATTWTTVDCSDWVPPSASDMFIEVYHLQTGASERFAMVRPYNWTDSADGVLSCTAMPELKTFAWLPNSSQQLDYKCTSSTSDVGLVILGYREIL